MTLYRHPSRITVNQLRSALQNGDRLQLVDVRPLQEFQIRHISGAVSCPLNELEHDGQAISSELPVYLLSESGSSADRAAEILKRRGVSIHVVAGGLRAWLAQGFPVTIDAASSSG